MRFTCASQPLECPVAVAAVRIDLGDRELIPMPSFEQLLQRRIRGRVDGRVRRQVAHLVTEAPDRGR